MSLGPIARRPALLAYSAVLVLALVLIVALVDLADAGSRVSTGWGGFALAALILSGVACAAALVASGLAVRIAIMRPVLRYPARAVAVLALALTLFVLSWSAARIAFAVVPPESTPNGTVTMFNPTGTPFVLRVNGTRDFALPATDAGRSWLPEIGSAVVRNATGLPTDGTFAWENTLTVTPASSGGDFTSMHVSVPHWLQTVNPLELYTLYLPTGKPAYLLLFQGSVIAENIPSTAGVRRANSALHPPSGGEILGKSHVNRSPQREGTLAGSVTIYNPTATAFTFTVNGTKQFTVAASSASTKWLPSIAQNPVPRSGTGQPSDGTFGWQNNVAITPESGGGETATAHVNIPTFLQTNNDLQLYLFYSPDFSQAVWVLMWQGEVQDSGGMK